MASTLFDDLKAVLTGVTIGVGLFAAYNYFTCKSTPKAETHEPKVDDKSKTSEKETPVVTKPKKSLWHYGRFYTHDFDVAYNLLGVRDFTWGGKEYPPTWSVDGTLKNNFDLINMIREELEYTLPQGNHEDIDRLVTLFIVAKRLFAKRYRLLEEQYDT